MNTPNKITIFRIIISILLLIFLLFPFYSFGITFNEYDIIGNKVLNSPLSIKYVIAGCVFIIAAVTDFVDGYIARKNDEVTDLGKMLDAIADKILVNGILVILAYYRMIPLAIPVIIITRDTIVDTCKMICGNKGKVIAASKTGKVKTVFVMIGISFIFFNNLPFELVGFDFANLCLIIGTILSVVSGCNYYFKARKLME